MSVSFHVNVSFSGIVVEKKKIWNDPTLFLQLQWNFSKPSSTGTKKYGRFCETSFAKNCSAGT
jgi:hypothetical protein